MIAYIHIDPLTPIHPLADSPNDKAGGGDIEPRPDQLASGYG